MHPRTVAPFILLRGFVRPRPIALAIPPQSREGVRESGWRLGRGEGLAKFVQGHRVSLAGFACVSLLREHKRRDMKQTRGIELPASFVVTVSLAGTEIVSTPPVENDILTVAEVAELLKCKKSSIYNLTRNRGQARYDNPIPVLRLPMGLRFRRSSVLAWLKSQETTSAA